MRAAPGAPERLAAQREHRPLPTAPVQRLRSAADSRPRPHTLAARRAAPPAPAGAPSRKLLQGWPEPPINVATPAGPMVIRRYPVSVQNIVGLNVLIPNFVQRGRGSGK